MPARLSSFDGRRYTMRRLLGALLFAFLIAASVRISWLSRLVIPALWLGAGLGLSTLIFWHIHRRAGGLVSFQVSARDALEMSVVFATGLVTFTALFAGYPTSAAAFLTGRLATMWVACQVTSRPAKWRGSTP